MRNSKIIALSVIVVSLTFNLAQSAPTTRAPQNNAETRENLANRPARPQWQFNEADFLVSDADLQQIVARQFAQGSAESRGTGIGMTELTYEQSERQLLSERQSADQAVRQVIQTLQATTFSTLAPPTRQTPLGSGNDREQSMIIRTLAQNQPSAYQAQTSYGDYLDNDADLELILAASAESNDTAMDNVMVVLQAQREEREMERQRRRERASMQSRRNFEGTQRRENGDYVTSEAALRQVLARLEREAAESILQNPDNYIGKEVEFDDVIRLLEYVDQAKEIPSPEEQFDDEAKDPTDACPICLGSLSKKPDKLNIDLPCEHRFHIRCIKFWVTEALGRDSDTGRATCPVCRSKINYEQLKLKRLSDDQSSSSDGLCD